jgi:hypothetical protein
MIHNIFKLYKNLIIENKFFIYNLLCISKICFHWRGLGTWRGLLMIILSNYDNTRCIDIICVVQVFYHLEHIC